MRQLTLAFLKIFFRNPRAMFFVIFLPAVILVGAMILGPERIFQFKSTLRYADFFLAGIMAYAIMQSCVYSVAYNLVDFRRNQILKRLSVTPLLGRQFIAAQSIARFIIGVLQAAVLLIIGFLVFQTKLATSMFWLPLIILTGTAVFLGVAFLIASLAKDYEEAAPYTSAIGLILLFLGDVFFPVGNLPQNLQAVAQVLPMEPFSALIRYALFGTVEANFTNNIWTLAIWLILLLVAAILIFEKKIYR